jgi:hypothetical protein
MNPFIIGSVRFVDGLERTVYLDDVGQFVLDGEERVYGVWIYIDEPQIIDWEPHQWSPFAAPQP